MKSGFPFSSFRITFSRRPPITFFLYIYIYKIVVIAISSPSYYNFSPLEIDSLLFLRRMCPLTRAATLHTRDFNEAKKGKRLTASATIASHRMYTCVSVCLYTCVRVYQSERKKGRARAEEIVELTCNRKGKEKWYLTGFRLLSVAGNRGTTINYRLGPVKRDPIRVKALIRKYARKYSRGKFVPRNNSHRVLIYRRTCAI